MEQTRNRLQGVLAAIGLLVLILDSSLALEGARSGIELCIKTVIPSLFPFFVLSFILTRSMTVAIASPVQRITGLLGIPEAAGSILVPAVLGGYPVGAKSVSDLFQQKQVSKAEADHLLTFCSNAGPSFLFGMVSGFFPERSMIWMLWIIHIFSAALTAISIPAERTIHPYCQQARTFEKTQAISSAARAMSLVCCWVILFRILITFLQEWFLWRFPPWLQVLLMGTLELTNGCCELLRITDIGLRFVLCSCMLAFGGICVLFQTAAVAKDLSIGCYWKGKLMQTVFSLLLSCTAVTKQGWIPALCIPIVILLLRKIQNKYRNPQCLPV